MLLSEKLLAEAEAERKFGWIAMSASWSGNPYNYGERVNVPQASPTRMKVKNPEVVLMGIGKAYEEVNA